MPIRDELHEVKIGSTTERLKVLSHRVSEQVPAHQNPLELTQRDFHGGHGTFRWNGKPVYYDGQSIDTTTPGVVVVGGEVAAARSIKRFIDYAFADDGGVFTTETSAAQNITANDMTLMPAAPAVNDAYYFGGSATFSGMYVYLGTQGAGTWTITWEYYTGSAWATLAGISDGTSNFKAAVGLQYVYWDAGQLTSSTVNSQAAFWVRARVSAFTSISAQPKGTQAWKESTATMDSAPVDLLYFGATQSILCATSLSIFEYDRTVQTWFQRVLFTGDSITKLCEFNGIAYIGRGSDSTKWYYTTDADTYTQTDLTNAVASYFLSAPNSLGTAYVLWSGKTPNQLYSTTDGRTAAAGGVALTSVAYIGDTSENITNIFLVGDKLMIGREDGLFYYDNTGGVHPIMPELRVHRSTNNFKYVTNYQGNVYVSLGTGVAELTSYNTYAMVGPLDNIDEIGKYGAVVGLTADKDFIYCALDEGTNTHIYKGNKTSEGWEWCPWLFLSTATTAVCLITPEVLLAAPTGLDEYRNIWIAKNNTVEFARVHDNPIAPSLSRVYPSTAFIRLPYSYGTDPNWDKLYQSIILEGYNLSASNTVTGKYRKDSETSMTSCTSALSTNGVTENNLSSALNSKRIQFELDFDCASASGTTPPYVVYFQARGIEQPEVVRIHDVVYYVYDNPNERTTDIRDFLRTARTTTSLIKLADLRYGDDTALTTYVWVMPEVGYPIEEEIVAEVGRQPELGIRMIWKEVSFTVS